MNCVHMPHLGGEFFHTMLPVTMLHLTTVVVFLRCAKVYHSILAYRERRSIYPYASFIHQRELARLLLVHVLALFSPA